MLTIQAVTFLVFVLVCVCVSACLCLCVCVCVCVHPDSKLRVLARHVLSEAQCSRRSSSRGAQEAHRALPNEALYGDLRLLGLIIPAYLHTAWQPG